MRASSQVFYQSCIGGGPDAPQQNQVRIILIGDHLEIIAGLKLPLGADRFGYHKLAALAQVRRHAV